MCDLKAAQMNVQHNLIQKFILHEFELTHYAMEATKNICCVKSERWKDNWLQYSNQIVQKMSLRLQEMQQTRSDRLKTIDSEVMFQAIETNLMNCT